RVGVWGSGSGPRPGPGPEADRDLPDRFHRLRPDLVQASRRGRVLRGHRGAEGLRLDLLKRTQLPGPAIGQPAELVLLVHEGAVATRRLATATAAVHAP